MIFSAEFMFYSTIFMIFGAIGMVVFLGVVVHLANREMAKHWSKKRPAKSGAAASPDAGAQPATG